MAMIKCPACEKEIRMESINKHLDRGCENGPDVTQVPGPSTPVKSTGPIAKIFQTPAKRTSSQLPLLDGRVRGRTSGNSSPTLKRQSLNVELRQEAVDITSGLDSFENEAFEAPATKRQKKCSNNLHEAMPLAEKARPRALDDIFGQDLVGPDGVLRGLIEKEKVPSMILWGLAGCGKTSIARVIANRTKCRFIELSATDSGVGECKKIFQEAKSELQLTGRKTILFCDEIHRFSKSQQDVFLAPVESGQITLIGATTENPSFKIQSALLSRCRVFTLNKLTSVDIEQILRRAMESESSKDGAGNPQAQSQFDDEMLSYLSSFADGDARTALNLFELAMSLSQKEYSKVAIKKALTKTLMYDRSGDMHYDTISAFHKSVRGSDPDGALFWLGRMLKSGEDPLYIARRMVVIASEDVGLADNSMLSLAIATMTATQQIGLPEARINLAHCAVALAEAKKSTRAYRGLNEVMSLLDSDPVASGAPVPYHLRNAPTKLMKEMGYGKDYKYNPDYFEGKVLQEYLPEQLVGRKFLDDRHLGLKRDPELVQAGAMA